MQCAWGLDSAYLCLWGFKHACEVLANRVEIQNFTWECCEVGYILLNVWQRLQLERSSLENMYVT